MKTSKKILITTGAILIALWVTILFVVRKDIKTIMAKQSVIEYRPVSVEKFMGLDFSANWTISIKQGKDCKVELGHEGGGNFEPRLNNINGTLYFSSTESIHARITAPALQVIKAAGDTRIEMKNFWSDTLTVILEDSASYSGSNNDFKNISFRASEK